MQFFFHKMSTHVATNNSKKTNSTGENDDFYTERHEEITSGVEDTLEFSEEEILKIVRKYPLALKYIDAEQQTPNIITAAVRKNGRALSFVKAAQQTNEICKAAIQQDKRAIQYVKLNSPALLLDMVKNHEVPIKYLTVEQKRIYSQAMKDHDHDHESPRLHSGSDTSRSSRGRRSPLANSSDSDDISSDLALASVLTAVEKDGLSLQHIDHAQLPAHIYHRIYMAAVQQNGMALRYINPDRQTDEICLAAVRQTGKALHLVVKQTPEIALAAVQQDGLSLHLVDIQTPEIALAAVQQNGMAVKYLRNQTPQDYRKIFIAAVQQCDRALQFVDSNEYSSSFHDIAMAAVQTHGTALIFVHRQTLELCMAAVQRTGLALAFVRIQNEPIAMAAVCQDGLALEYVKYSTPEFGRAVSMAAVTQNGMALKFVKLSIVDHAIIAAAVAQNGLALQFADKQNDDVCEIAIKQCARAILYVKKVTPRLVELAVNRDRSILSELSEENRKIYEKTHMRDCDLPSDACRSHIGKSRSRLSATSATSAHDRSMTDLPLENCPDSWNGYDSSDDLEINHSLSLSGRGKDNSYGRPPLTHFQERYATRFQRRTNMRMPDDYMGYQESRHPVYDDDHREKADQYLDVMGDSGMR
jgi:hypothetical protein